MRNAAQHIHDLFSASVYTPVSHLLRFAIPSRRGVIAAYYDGMRVRRASLSWSPDRKRSWILARLRNAVRRAYQNTVHYRELLDTIGFDPNCDFSFEDYAHIPVLEREAVQSAGRRLVSVQVPANLLKRDSTGGSTGTPTEIWLGPEEAGWRESGIATFMERIGARAGCRTALLWGHHLDPVKSTSFHDRWYSFATNVHWFDCFRLSPQVLEIYHEEFSRLRPACIVAYASALGQLAEHLLERGYEASYPTLCLVTGGEKLLPRHRKAITFAFDRPVHERYGARDTGCIGFQSNPDRSLDFDIDWPSIFIEPETEEPFSPILLTKLHGDGMPMLRYRVGDMACFPSGSRPGQPVFNLHEVLGREVDRIWLRDGRWIHGAQLPHLMKDQPVREFMLLQRPDYSVEIRVIPRDTLSAEHQRSILSAVGANLPGIEIQLRVVDQITRTPSNKQRPVISHAPPVRRRAVL